MKRHFVLLLTIALSLPLAAQTGWEKTWKQQQEAASYKSAYATAEKALGKSTSSRERLTAAYCMTQSAIRYQEDSYDSAVVRYRRLLPQLDDLDRALCYSFLGAFDTALLDTALLQRTPVEQVRAFCHEGKTQNMTPTVYDMLVTMMQDQVRLLPKDRLEWQRRLCAFHDGDPSDDLRIWHDLRLLNYMDDIPNQKLSLQTIQQYINKYRGTRSPMVTKLYQMAAGHCAETVEAVHFCDTAISLFPKSEGGVECANLRFGLTCRIIRIAIEGLSVMPGEPSLQRVEYRSLDHLWFRVVPYDQGYLRPKEGKSRILKTSSVCSFDLAVPGNDSYRSEEAYFALPPLKAGRYLLLVSPSEDFSKEGCMVYEVRCTEMELVKLSHGNYMLLDRRSGLPIGGQDVRLVTTASGKEKLLATTVTAADGRFHFDIETTRWGDRIVIERDGYRFKEIYNNFHGQAASDSKLRIQLKVDRPIYRPGDTVHSAILAYTTDGLDGMVAPGSRMQLVLRDPNGREVATDSLTADDYGVAATTFVLPTDRVAGEYTLRVYSESGIQATESLRVEEYRQPRFMVTLNPTEEHHAPAFGKAYSVKGMATAYSGVPVGGAKVHYSVTRTAQNFYRWHHWHNGASARVIEGEATADPDGSFSIAFVPEPDSNYMLDSNTVFLYTVHADVTDLNGESHEASTALRVGFRNSFIDFDENGSDYSDLPQLTLRLHDPNDRPLDGTVQLRVERLRCPTQTVLTPRVMVPRKVHHTMSREEWQRLFPLFAYDTADVQPSSWPVADMVVGGEWNVENGELKVPLPPLVSGYYRITAAAHGASTLTRTICLTRKEERRVQSHSLLWHDLDRNKAEVGERVALQFGSPVEGTQIYYTLRIGEKDSLFRRIDCSDGRIHTEYIDVDSAMLGGFQMELFAVREGVRVSCAEQVEVPFTHKKLDVEISTFRDRLLPGQTEQWTITARPHIFQKNKSGNQNTEIQNSEPTALVLSMYDDALNSYQRSGWHFSPWRSNHSTCIDFSSIDYYLGSADWLSTGKWHTYNGSYPSVWTLVDALPRYRGVPMSRFSTASTFAQNRVMAKSTLATVAELAEEEEGLGISLAADKSAASLAGDFAIDGDMDETIPQTDVEDHSEVQLRQNLSPLAFFAADVRTDSTGSATYRFTVPELLTRWNVRGLAVSRDLKIGTLDKTLVTSKPLMVQPNMPRFLRQGDSLALMAKVVKAEGGEVPVEVQLLLTDAATGDTLCLHTEHIAVKDAAQVLFPVEVPQGVYAAIYRITAVADGMSDGEQGQVPVLGNRQAVAVSQAMYINGVGEKTYHLPEWLAADTSRHPLLVAAEAVSNPIWLAVKSMPYFKTLENPSTLYLANQLYINGLGQQAIDAIGLIKDIDTTAPASPLSLNEDFKQTALQATPWLQAAESEEEQMRAVRNYLDTAAMRRQDSQILKQLLDLQNPDGGWPWMPEGKSSLWVTQSVLQKLATHSPQPSALNSQRSALQYVDREQQQYYEHYIKPYLKKGYNWQPTDIDYLFMRSLYTAGTPSSGLPTRAIALSETEAYKFYYNNALKNYRRYDNLYTQAQLALVFHRHGDRKASLDLLRRIKEKSLQSDEMGLYWRDNRSGWHWYSRPIETQALLIQAFAEITPRDTAAIGLMQQWLLKQKQTTHWGNDRATAAAIAALMVGAPAPSAEAEPVSLTVFGTPVTAPATSAEGRISQRWTGPALDTLAARRSSLITLKKSTPGIAWASVSYLFSDDIDKIPASESGITLKRSYLAKGDTLHVGDRLTVRIEIRADRAMDYLELVDGRPSCTEPLSTRAGWRWSDGLAYYIVYNGTDTRCYIEHLDKGRYVFEYEVYITNPGTFLAGPVTMQCMYAPEFRATAPAERLTVE
ncbi:MAG: hypothetical protein IJ745_05550 [Bacteroidales bacterium]|nr:hypothetical protein [Bacteroidales bacterium]